MKAWLWVANCALEEISKCMIVYHQYMSIWAHTVAFPYLSISFHRVSQVTFNLGAILVRLASHLQSVRISNKYYQQKQKSNHTCTWYRLSKKKKKEDFSTCGGILEPAYDRVFGREISSWAAWASSPSSSGRRGSEGMLVTVISSTTKRWSDRENTCTSSSSLNEGKEDEKQLSWKYSILSKGHIVVIVWFLKTCFFYIITTAYTS